MIANIARAGVLAFAVTAATAGTAAATSRYDGRWSLSIETKRGACTTYVFPVQITKGKVSVPGLVRVSGHVTAKGNVRVSVAVGDKSAAGSGKLTQGSGRGNWTGKAGTDRCSGSWTAQRA